MLEDATIDVYTVHIQRLAVNRNATKITDTDFCIVLSKLRTGYIVKYVDIRRVIVRRCKIYQTLTVLVYVVPYTLHIVAGYRDIGSLQYL